MTTDDGKPRRRLLPSVLHVLLAIYGILYLLFVIISFFPAEEGSPVSDRVPYHPFGLDGSPSLRVRSALCHLQVSKQAPELIVAQSMTCTAGFRSASRQAGPGSPSGVLLEQDVQ